MLPLILQRTIACSSETVRSMINDPNGNPFILGYPSNFEPGTPIVMKMKLLGGIVIKQKERIFENNGSTLFSSGINLPLNFLSSIRHHKRSNQNNGDTVYESFFELRGFLSPMIKLLMASSFRAVLIGMTDGEAMRIHRAAHCQQQ